MSGKALVICLDGATFDLLGPWIEGGQLPTLRHFVQEGASGELESVIPPITAPAWASFMTGKNPGKHGIYHFVNRGLQGNDQGLVSGASRTGRTLWDLLGDEGKRVVVLNVPTTYPPQTVNGALISDFLTPPGKRDFTYPPSLLDEIEAKFGSYPLYLKTLMFSANLTGSNTERLLKELHHELRYKFAVAHYLLDKYQSDFTILHILGTDRIQHELWNLIDPRHPKYNWKMGERYRDEIIAYFTEVDAEISRLLNKSDDAFTTFIISDHGFGPIHRAIDLNVWLLEQGYIRIKNNGRSRFKFHLWKSGLTSELIARVLLKTFFKHGAGIAEKVSDETVFKWIRFFAERGQNNPLFSLADVDWSGTKAYALVGIGAINVNLAGREPNGSVSPGKEYQALREEILEKLRELRDPDTNARVNGQVVMREQVYHGPYVDQAPDILFLPNRTGYVAGSMMGFTANKSIVDSPAWPGHHRMNGIFLAKGKYIRQGKSIEGARLLDLAPTILYLMGCKVPSDMDGKVLSQIFEQSFVDEHSIEYADGATSEEGPQSLSVKEEGEAIRRLRELGYLM